MITLLALILRLVVLAVFTFGFVVLFEHGTKNYLDHAKDDAVVLQQWVEAKLGSGMTKSAPPAPSSPEPSSSPEPTPAPEPSSTPEHAPAPSATPEATPLATPMATPVTPPPMPSPTVTAPQASDVPAAAPSDWQSLQNKPIDDGLAPPSQ